MNVAIVTIGYNLAGATARLIASAERGCRNDLHFVVFLHSQIPAKMQELETLAKRRDVSYRDYGKNRGLAKSWNEGIEWSFEQNFDVMLVVNEDVTFGEGDVDRMAECAIHRGEAPIVTGRAYHRSEGAWGSSEYGCFAFNPLAQRTVGSFDENFFPIYCEDSDYRRRLALAGLAPAFCESTRIVHTGSESLSQTEVAHQNGHTYLCNRKYYRRKWGHDAGQETLDRPFGDPRFTYYIDPLVRAAPYPGFNRTDHSIVRL